MPLQKLLFSATLTQNPEKLQQLGLYQPRLFSTELVGRGPRDADGDGDSGGKYAFPMGLTVSRALGEGRGGVPAPGPGQPRAIPSAPLRALPPELQAAGGSAPGPGRELLKGPLLHQLPRELPQVRSVGQASGQAGRRAGPSPPAPALPTQALPARPGLRGRGRGRVLLPPQPRPAQDDPEAVRAGEDSAVSAGAGSRPCSGARRSPPGSAWSPAGGGGVSWLPATAGPTAPRPTASSARTPRPAASTCGPCSWWSTTTPPSTCGPTCTGEGWLGRALTGGVGREAAPADPRRAALEGPALAFRVGRTARAGDSGQAFTLLLRVQVRPGPRWGRWGGGRQPLHTPGRFPPGEALPADAG